MVYICTVYNTNVDKVFKEERLFPIPFNVLLININWLLLFLFQGIARSIDGIPPTRAALKEHVHGTVFQGGIVWGWTLFRQPLLPSPSEWRQQRQGSIWTPYWTALPQALQVS